MNMLNNKIPFGLLSKDEQDTFRKVGKSNLNFYESGSFWTYFRESRDFEDDKIYRLKLVDGEWYTFRIDNNIYIGTIEEVRQTSFDVKIMNMGDWFIQDYARLHSFDEFRSATQEEIDSIQTKFKRGDVITLDGQYGNKGKILIARIKVNKKEKYNNYYSIINYSGELTFNRELNHSHKYAKFATKDQIKKLELEEMKHGKKWNGDGYDDWLTYDGLTWNEIIEHDLSEIEVCIFDGHKKIWVSSVEDDLEVYNIDRLRLKPKEQIPEGFIKWDGGKCPVDTGTRLEIIRRDGTRLNSFDTNWNFHHKNSPFDIIAYRIIEEEKGYKDVKIEWSEDGYAYVDHPTGESLSLECVPIHTLIGGWILSSYVFECYIVRQQPITFAKEWTKIVQKATHARFVKVGE